MSSEGTIIFVEAARSYCAYLVASEQFNYVQLCGLLISVAEAELKLDWPEEDYDESEFDDYSSRAQVDEEMALEKTIKVYMEKDISAFCSFYELKEEDDETFRMHRLPGDLAELYGDLKEGLRFWDMETKTSRLHAEWTWKFGSNHWMDHLCRGLWSLQQLRMKESF